LTFEIVVVDNDAQRSAEATVQAFSKRTHIATTYECEPVQSISLARNRAIRKASGTLVAFIDDDEWPVEEWLSGLHVTLQTHGADGVLGPVVADYPPGAPKWLRKGRFFDRRRLPTGARISAGDARTGNVLLDRRVFAGDGPWFDPALGRTGGEDSEFFDRQLRQGRTFVWCDEAVVYESIPPERWRARFHLRRLLRSGVLQGEWMRAGRIRSGEASVSQVVARNAAILLGCALLSMPAVLLPRHVGMRIWQKGAYCGGLIAAYCGFSILRERDGV
jgi:glycosyltransferase involved in cell wall biosynthesis